MSFIEKGCITMDELVLCCCGGKPQIKREQRSYGIITGMKYAYWVQCPKCKKRTKKIFLW